MIALRYPETIRASKKRSLHSLVALSLFAFVPLAISNSHSAAKTSACFKQVPPVAGSSVYAGNYPLCRRYERYLNEHCEVEKLLERRPPGKLVKEFQWPPFERVDASQHLNIAKAFVDQLGARNQYPVLPWQRELLARYSDAARLGQFALYRTLLDVDKDGVKEHVYVAEGLPLCFTGQAVCRLGPRSVIVDPKTGQPKFRSARMGRGSSDVMVSAGRVYFSDIEIHFSGKYRIELNELNAGSRLTEGIEGVDLLSAVRVQLCVFDSINLAKD